MINRSLRTMIIVDTQAKADAINRLPLDIYAKPLLGGTMGTQYDVIIKAFDLSGKCETELLMIADWLDTAVATRRAPGGVML